jgi:hypothetical protein
VFGTPADVTLEEIALELLYPADAFTEKTVRGAALPSAPVHLVLAVSTDT